MAFLIVLLVSSGVLLSSAMASNSSTPSLSHPVLISTTTFEPTSVAAVSTQMHINSSSSLPTSIPVIVSSAVPTTAKPTTPTPTPPGRVTMSYGENNVACVTISGKVSFDVKYNTTTNQTKTAQIYVTAKNLTTSGKCPGTLMENSTSMIKVKWEDLYEMSVMFSFGSNASWYVSEISFSAIAKENPKFDNATEGNYSATKLLSKSANSGYHASGNHSYLCNADRMLPLSGDISVDFESLQMQPFDKVGNFSKADVCSADSSDSKPNSLVPIIVGCALAGLIVIVLIAYLVGRRKSSRGYQQV